MELPSSYQYIDTGENTYRANLFSSEDVNKWIEEYSHQSDSNWVIYFQSTKSKRYVYRKILYCRYSSLRKKKNPKTQAISRNTGCTAQLHLFVKLTTPYTARKDKYVKMGFPGIIKIVNIHNHPKVLYHDAAKAIFLKHFRNGLNVIEALRAYKSENHELSGQDNSVVKQYCPRYATIYCWYQRWKMAKINSEPFLQRLFSTKAIKNEGNKDLIKLFENKIKTIGITEEFQKILFDSLAKICTPEDWMKIIKRPKVTRKSKSIDQKKNFVLCKNIKTVDNKAMLSCKNQNTIITNYDTSDNQDQKPIFITNFPNSQEIIVPFNQTTFKRSVFSEKKQNPIIMKSFNLSHGLITSCDDQNVTVSNTRSFSSIDQNNIFITNHNIDSNIKLKPIDSQPQNVFITTENNNTVEKSLSIVVTSPKPIVLSKQVVNQTKPILLKDLKNISSVSQNIIPNGQKVITGKRIFTANGQRAIILTGLTGKKSVNSDGQTIFTINEK